jgi:hypothetical protein
MKISFFVVQTRELDSVETIDGVVKIQTRRRSSQFEPPAPVMRLDVDLPETQYGRVRERSPEVTFALSELEKSIYTIGASGTRDLERGRSTLELLQILSEKSDEELEAILAAAKGIKPSVAEVIKTQ